MDRFEMGRFSMTPQSAFTTTTVAGAERVTAFLRKVYGWMCVGLAITAGVALAVTSAPGLQRAVLGNPFLFFGLIIAELGMVFVLAARVTRLKPTTAAGLFLAYSVLNGVTLSMILLAYSGISIATTFVVTAGMFGALALFGSTTKRSLAGVGQFAFMGLIGLMLAMLVGFFWHSSALQFVISVVGVIVFTGLTAWDAQRLKQMAAALPEGSVGSYAVVGALSLYLDFINLFLFLLRFLGGGRRD
jgi:FtsH-binding integral membrane protein